MTHAAAPMPEGLRHQMRAKHHPARSVDCPWCHAHPHQPCRIPSRATQPAALHQQRMAAWAQTTACCTTCQVTPTVPCHHDGRALADGAVHPARETEAGRTAA